MNIIDAHPHIYSADRTKYPVIDDPWNPGEPATAEDLRSKMDDAGVSRAVFIQTSTFYGWDNRYVRDSTRQYAEWATGVVTLSPDDPQHLEVLEDAVKNYSVRGLRGTTDQNGKIGSPNVKRLWTKARDLGIVVNCMVLDDLDRVQEIEALASELDDLNIVIDHCFMLNTFRKTEDSLLALEKLASQPNIHAKLTSGTHGSTRVYPRFNTRLPTRRHARSSEPSHRSLHATTMCLGIELPERTLVERHNLRREPEPVHKRTRPVSVRSRSRSGRNRQ